MALLLESGHGGCFIFMGSPPDSGISRLTIFFDLIFFPKQCLITTIQMAI